MFFFGRLSTIKQYILLVVIVNNINLQKNNGSKLKNVAFTTKKDKKQICTNSLLKKSKK